MLFCISFSLIWAHSLGAQTSILASGSLYGHATDYWFIGWNWDCSGFSCWFWKFETVWIVYIVILPKLTSRSSKIKFWLSLNLKSYCLELITMVYFCFYYKYLLNLDFTTRNGCVNVIVVALTECIMIDSTLGNLLGNC